MLCQCGIALRDVDLIQTHMHGCVDQQLRRVCHNLCYEDHAAVALELRDAVTSAKQSHVPCFAPVGIIIPAGGSELLTQLVVNITSLRATGCALPVTVAHADELTPAQIRYLKTEHGVDIFNLASVMPRGDWRGFQIKLAALANAIYGVCILSDADIIWMRDPDLLIRRMRDEDATVLLFRDFWNFQTKQHNKTLPTAWLYAAHGVPATGNEVESGVVVWDSSHIRMRAALRFIALRHEYFFKITFGDKDLYKLAAHVAGAKVVMMPPPELLCFRDDNVASNMCIGHSMLQHAGSEVSHIHTTLFPFRRGEQIVPLPTVICTAEDVNFIRFRLQGKETETVGCDTGVAHVIAASDVHHNLCVARKIVAQLSVPW